VADAQLRGHVDKGEALVREGQKLEAARSLDEAYEKYCRGLQYLLEVMPKLPEDDPAIGPLRVKISGYLEQAEKLKENLEAQEGASAGDLPSTRQAQDPGVPGAPPPPASSEGDGAPAAASGGRSRSRSRRRHRKHHSSHGHHGARELAGRHGRARRQERSGSRARRRPEDRDTMGGGADLRPAPDFRPVADLRPAPAWSKAPPSARR